MAETVEEIKALLAAYEEMKKAAADSSATDAFKTHIRSLGPIMDALKGKLAGGTAALGVFAAAANKVSVATFIGELSSIGNKISDFIKGIGFSSKNLKELGLELGAFYAIGSSRLEISNGFKELGDVADGTTAQMGAMFDRVSKLAPELVKKFGSIGAGAKVAFGQIAIVKKMETGLLMNAAAAGNLDAALSSIGGSMTNLSDMTLNFSRLTAEAGTANNITAGQAAKYAQQLMKIPGALAEVIETTDKTSGYMNMLDATIKVATGTFQPFGKVMKDITMLFENWNKKGKDSLDFVTKMASAAQSLKMPMDIMRDYVHGVGEQFKFLGDNTTGAIDIMKKIAPAFESSKLGPKAIGELVGNMTQGVAKMDAAQRAFLSAQTGGPGGLQGSYQIQQQLAEGDTIGVMSKVEDTLKKMFGGPIVTLKEAATDQRASAQYTKQVQMMTTGPMKIANDEMQAKAMIDAMASGKIFDAEAASKEAQDPLEQAMSRGNDIQTRQFDELVWINNHLERNGVVLADIAYGKVRKTIGPGSDEGQEREGRMLDIRKEASDDAVHRGFQKDGPKPFIPGGTRQKERDVIYDAPGKLAEGIGNVLNRLLKKDLPKKASRGVESKEAQTAEYKEQIRGLEKEGFSKAEATKIVKSKKQPEGRVRRDMATAQELADEREGRGGSSTGRRSGIENKIIVQVNVDDQIRKTVEVLIDQDGNMKPYN